MEIKALAETVLLLLVHFSANVIFRITHSVIDMEDTLLTHGA